VNGRMSFAELTWVEAVAAILAGRFSPRPQLPQRARTTSPPMPGA